MITSVSFNSAQMLALDSNVSINSISTFNAQEAYENTFEDVVQENISQNEVAKNDNQSSFSNYDFKKIETEKTNFDQKQNYFITKEFDTINFKNAMNKYILESIK